MRRSLKKAISIMTAITFFASSSLIFATPIKAAEPEEGTEVVVEIGENPEVEEVVAADSSLKRYKWTLFKTFKAGVLGFEPRNDGVRGCCCVPSDSACFLHFLQQTLANIIYHTI